MSTIEVEEVQQVWQMPAIQSTNAIHPGPHQTEFAILILFIGSIIIFIMSLKR